LNSYCSPSLVVSENDEKAITLPLLQDRAGASPEIIQLAVMLYVRFPLSLRNVEDLLHERGIDICHETVRHWVDRFGTHFAYKIRKHRSERMRQSPQWQWHLDEVFVKIRGKTHYLWRAVDHEGEVLESFVTKTRDKASALRIYEKSYEALRQSQGGRDG
jgi:putative transposase